MKTFCTILLSFILSVLFYSCNRVNTDELLNRAETLVSMYPDSALKIISDINPSRSLNDIQSARYGWISGLSHEKKNHSLIYDSLSVHSLKYYKSIQDTAKLIPLYRVVAKYYLAHNDYQNSDSVLDDGIYLAKNINDSSSVARFYIQKTALRIRTQYRYDEAEYFLKESLKYKENSSAYYTLGAWFSGKDSINYYLDKSTRLAFLENDSARAAFYMRNMADVMASKFDKNSEALRLLKQSALLPSSEVPELSFSYIYLNLGKIDSAEHYLNITKDRLNSLISKGYHITSSAQNNIAMLQAVIDYSHNKKFDFGSINRYNDSIFSASIDQYKNLQASIESRYNLEKENMELTIRQQQSQFIFLAIVFLITLIGGVIILYTRSRKRRLLEAEEKIETLNHLLKEVTENTGEVQDSLFFKKMLLQQLGLIRLVAAVPTSANQELLKQIACISTNDIPTDTLLAWQDLYPIIDSIYNNFHTRLIALYGDILIEKEHQLCCLLCAEFSTKEIQVVTQQSIPTIYQRKTTIRKKLGIGEKEDIIDFLNRQFALDSGI